MIYRVLVHGPTQSKNDTPLDTAIVRADDAAQAIAIVLAECAARSISGRVTSVVETDYITMVDTYPKKGRR